MKERKDWFTCLIIFLCCLPYWAPLEIMASDLQPWPLLGAIVWLFYHVYRSRYAPELLTFKAVQIFFFICFTYAVITSLFTGGIELRSIGNYASLFIFSIVGFWAHRECWAIRTGVVLASCAWTASGLIQILFDRTFATSFVRAARTTSDRGVTGLAPEPSYYGIACLFMTFAIRILVVNGIISRKSATLLTVAFVSQMLFCAQSITALIGLAVWVFFLIFLSWRPQNIATSLLVLVVGSGAMGFYLNTHQDSRLAQLLGKLTQNPTLILGDASANERFGDIAYSLKSFWDQLPLPLGYGSTTWLEYRERTRHSISVIYRDAFFGRIMSGYGSAIFEIGLFGVLLVLLVFRVYWRTRVRELRVIGITLSFFMFMAIPLGTPLFGLLLGLTLGAPLRKYN